MSRQSIVDGKRPKRTPLGSRARLKFDKKEPGFTYRVINDVDDRLIQAQEAGYEFVTGDGALGDPRVAEGGRVDSRISKPVGNGVRGFLMRIPDEYYNADQAEKEKRIAATEAAMKPDKSKNQYGSGLTNE